ncbi:hypothetical protein GCM10010512_37830 [Streptomyces thermoviolaceus subsp. thermoviolaceus]|nr:hypothetical protein GCM10010512_37830 [Streptomyces thermoviolaceus subsp. thermoviolaceus]
MRRLGKRLSVPARGFERLWTRLRRTGPGGPPDTAERLAELLRQGEPFDTVTGLPDSLRGGKVVLSLLELALKYIDARWAEASAKQGGTA